MNTSSYFCAALILLAAIGDTIAAEPKADNDLRHPERVSIPDDIPFTTTVTGMLNKEDRQPRTARIFFPAIDYQKGHYEGWQAALLTVRSDGIAIARTPHPTRLAVATNSPTLVRGMEAGYRPCLEMCEVHLKQGESEKRLRRHCADAYAPAIPAPPPIPRAKSAPNASPESSAGENHGTPFRY
jgi:hypothetical protein